MIYPLPSPNKVPAARGQSHPLLAPLLAAVFALGLFLVPFIHSAGSSASDIPLFDPSQYSTLELAASTLNDGIPDVWKTYYGLSNTDTTVANADYNKSGIMNLEKYQLNLQPFTPPDPTLPLVPKKAATKPSSGSPSPSLLNGNFRNGVNIGASKTSGGFTGSVFNWSYNTKVEGWQALVGKQIEVWRDSKGQQFVELNASGSSRGIEQKISDVVPGTYLLTWRDLCRNQNQAGNGAYKLHVFAKAKRSAGSLGGTFVTTTPSPVNGIYLPLKQANYPDVKDWQQKCVMFTLTKEMLEATPDVWVAFEPQSDATYGAFIAEVKLTPLEIKPRQIKPNGSIGEVSPLTTSMPSPLITVTEFQPIKNVRVQADGKIFGDLTVRGTLSSQACDTIPGEQGQIDEVQFYVNDADTPQARVVVNSTKGNKGTGGRPYPYAGTFEMVVANVPLVEGNNVFKFTARDKVYNIPGFHTWATAVRLADHEDNNTGGNGGLFADFSLKVKLASPVVAAGQAQKAVINYGSGGTASPDMAMTETSAGSGIFLPDDTAVTRTQLKLVGMGSLTLDRRDKLQASLVILGSKPIKVSLGESSVRSGLFSGGFVSNSGGGNTGDPPGPNQPPGPNNPPGGGGGGGGGGDNPQPPPPDVEVDYPESIDQSNGGEFYPYALQLTLPPELTTAAGTEMEVNGERLAFKQIGEDKKYIGYRKDTDQMAIVSCRQSEQPEAEQQSNEKDDKILADIKKNNTDFFKAFCMGLGAGGMDLVGATVKPVVGATKYLGRGLLVATLEVKFFGQWLIGANTDKTVDMIVEVGQPNVEINEMVAATATTLAKWGWDNAATLNQIQLGLLTGDIGMVNDALLHGSETNRQIAMFCSEALAQTMNDLRNESEGVRGYRAGRIFFEAAAIIFPFTKAGKVLQLTKTEFLTQILNKNVLSTHGAKIAEEMISKLATTTMCFLPGTKIKSADGARNIEDIRADMMVWSRNEFTGESGWKRVVQTFVTHPTRIHHLTYALRGPPGSRTETLGVTGPHPFWVINRDQVGFVPAEDLHAGDMLSLADGGTAEVTANVTEEAPAGGTFTTYNFEVEDFHTYFAGEAGVWVHNDCPAKDKIASVFFQKAKKLKQSGGGELAGKRFKVLEETKAEFRGIPDISTSSWAQSVKDVQSKMAKDLATGKIVVADMPSVKDMRAFNRRQPAPGTAGNHVHHSVEAWIQRDKLGLTEGFDDVPGWMIEGSEHTFGVGRPKAGTLAGDLEDAIKPIASGNYLEVSTAMKQVYQKRGLDDLWDVTKVWLSSKGIPTP